MYFLGKKRTPVFVTDFRTKYGKNVKKTSWQVCKCKSMSAIGWFNYAKAFLVLN